MFLILLFQVEPKGPPADVALGLPVGPPLAQGALAPLLAQGAPPPAEGALAQPPAQGAPAPAQGALAQGALPQAINIQNIQCKHLFVLFDTTKTIIYS